MAKNRIFSGRTLSESARKKIEEQLKRSRERDIKAQQESNERRKQRKVKTRLNKLRPYVGGATSGTEAHYRYKAIMDNIRKQDREEVRGFDYNDVFVAADALIDDTTDYWSAEEFEEYIMKYLSALLD